MSVLENNVKAKIIETKSMEANITIKTILDIACKHWTKCLDNYYVMDSEPELSTDDCGDNVTVSLNCYDRINLDHLTDDVTMLVEEELENFIKDKNAAELTHQRNDEEGENGSL